MCVVRREGERKNFFGCVFSSPVRGLALAAPTATEQTDWLLAFRGIEEEVSSRAAIAAGGGRRGRCLGGGRRRRRRRRRG